MATVGQSATGIANGDEGLNCFVCDASVVGKYYPLATCRTQSSKVRLIEKLGQLVGDEYMVVIAEDDIICRGCATMINSLDRLEKELGSIRSMVLRYLEKKYEMPEGELVNSRANAPTQVKERGNPDHQNDFQARKRRAMMNTGEHLPEDIRGAGKDASFLQCDKCKYTTNFGSFMAAHTRCHLKKKEAAHQGATSTANPPVSQGQAQQTSQQQQPSQSQAQTSMQTQMVVQRAQTVQVHSELSQTIQMQAKQNGDKSSMVQIHRLPEGSEVITAQDISGGKATANLVEGGETVEMIAAEIGQDFNDGSEKGQMLAMVEVDKHMTLQAVEGEDGNNTLCMVDENGIIVQKVEQAEDGTLYVQVPDGTDNTKQVLSVAEDGSVQMVEVLWDDMVTDETEGHSMVTF